MPMPSYLKGNEDAFARDPRAANLEWFRNAKYGLFLHYGLYSQLGRHEWVQLREKIRPAEYAKLADSFTAEKFDAGEIARFAVQCGMRYINITTRHHDSFCLFETAQTDFNSLNAPSGRDLVHELAEACEENGLALFLYYSHGRDWKHPHAPNNDIWGGRARPEYDPPEESYAYGDDHNLEIYLDFMKEQITELVRKNPTVAGIWLDGIAVPKNGPTEKFRCQDLYDHIHSLEPHLLLSYKQGLLGTEDFFAPEHSVPGAGDDPNRAGKISEHTRKVIEICTTMITNPLSWGYYEGAEHRDAAGVWEALRKARSAGANLLLNTGPKGDGSLDPADAAAMRTAGLKLREEGFPGEPGR